MFGCLSEIIPSIYQWNFAECKQLDHVDCKVTIGFNVNSEGPQGRPYGLDLAAAGPVALEIPRHERRARRALRRGGGISVAAPAGDFGGRVYSCLSHIIPSAYYQTPPKWSQVCGDFLLNHGFSGGCLVLGGWDYVANFQMFLSMVSNKDC